jgi:hypothetical protein
MRRGEQAAEARLIFGRAIQGGEEGFPLLVILYESRLVQKGLFRPFASATNDEIGDAHALPLSGSVDDGFFLCRGAE